MYTFMTSPNNVSKVQVRDLGEEIKIQELMCYSFRERFVVEIGHYSPYSATLESEPLSKSGVISQSHVDLVN